MKIVLLGATGATGKEVLDQALAAGDTVIAVARTPAKLTRAHPRLSVIRGDATDANVLAGAMAGDAVLISTLGSMKDTTLMTNATKAIIAAAKRTGLKRIIMMSSFAVRRDQLKGLTKFITGIVLRKALADKTAGEALLRDSSLDWTIVYASALTNDTKAINARVISTSEKLGMTSKISRTAVANWILHEARDAEYIDKDVTISR